MPTFFLDRYVKTAHLADQADGHDPVAIELETEGRAAGEAVSPSIDNGVEAMRLVEAITAAPDGMSELAMATA